MHTVLSDASTASHLRQKENNCTYTKFTRWTANRRRPSVINPAKLT